MADEFISETDRGALDDLRKSANQIQYQSYLDSIINGRELKPTQIKHMQALEVELGLKSPELKKLSFDEVVEKARCSRRTLAKHIKEQKIVKSADGYFLEGDVEQWLERFGARFAGAADRKSADDNGDSYQDRLAQENLLIAQYKRQMIEFEIKKKRGELIPQEEHNRILLSLATVVDDCLRKLANRLAYRLTGKTAEEIRTLIQNETDTVREVFYRDGISNGD
jgi:hypothetical protein